MSADGSGAIIIDDGPEVLPRDGIHFTRRRRSQVLARNKCILDIYRTIGRQARKVGSTDTADIEEATIALKRFCLTNLEAQLAERQLGGKLPARDMLICEVFSEFMLARPTTFQNEEEKTRIEKANVCFRYAIIDAQRAWPDNPTVSSITRNEQKRFVKVSRADGLKDSSIGNRLGLIFAMFRWAKAEGKQTEVPGKIRDEEWAPYTESSKDPYTLEQLAALLNEAGRIRGPGRRRPDRPFVRARREHEWRFMILALCTGARPDCINSLTWPQFLSYLDARVVRLNPAGRAQTRKRRPTLPVCPTLETELSQWRAAPDVHPKWVVTHRGKRCRRHSFFENLRRRAGLPGSAMILRHTIRTWLAQHGVIEAQADRFVGHAEEGSATGRVFYKHMNPTYLRQCIEAIEKLFDALQPLVLYPLGHRRPGNVVASQAAVATVRIHGLRSNCVATDLTNLLNSQVPCIF